jgi:hypothetical protein
VRTAFRLALPVTGTVVVFVVLLAVRALPVTRSLAIWVVLLTAIALRELVRSIPRHEQRPAFEAALGRRDTVAPAPAPFAGMERELQLAAGYADHAHRRLFPLLRATAAARLSTSHGIDLERRPDAARRVLGDDVWELLRPDRPQPADGLANGPRREEIAAVISRLESL